MSSNPHLMIVEEKKGRFFCFVPTLSIIETGDTLAEAYEKAYQRKKTSLQQLQELHLTPPPRSSSRTMNLLILTLLLLVPLMTVLYPISRLIQKCAYFITLHPSELVTKISQRIETMPPQERLEFQQALQAFNHQLDTLISEKTGQEPHDGPH